MVKAHGGRLSLEKFAAAKLPRWDKRDLVVRRNELKLRQLGKLKKVKKRMEADGRLAAPAPTDNVLVLEADELPSRPSHRHSEAGPNADAAPPSTSQPDGEAHERRRGKRGRHEAPPHTDTAGPSSRMQQVPRGASATTSQPASEHSPEPTRHARPAVAPSQPQRQPQAATESKSQQPASGTPSKPRSAKHEASLQPRPAKRNDASLKAQPASAGGPADEALPLDAPPRRLGKQKPPRRMSQLERIAAEVQQRKAAEQAERDKVAKLRAEHHAKVEAAERARRQTKAKYLKKTSRGQPLMSVRVDKILQTLQRGA